MELEERFLANILRRFLTVYYTTGHPEKQGKGRIVKFPEFRHRGILAGNQAFFVFFSVRYIRKQAFSSFVTVYLSEEPASHSGGACRETDPDKSGL
jgi:hypothetical protein